MTNTEHFHPRNLTFSQAQGYETLPRPLALEELSYDARRELWDLLYASIRHAYRSDYLDDEWLNIARTLHRDFLKIPIDQFDPYVSSFSDQYRSGILENLRFNEVFDLLQIVMRHDDCPVEFVRGVQAIFERWQLAYLVDTNGPPTILPMSTRREGEAISEAIRTFQSAGLAGPETHLRRSAEFINQGNWSDSIRESIHAVESIARILSPDAAKTLAPALRALEKRHPIHGALREGFNKLYGYTSDEQGIRHPLNGQFRFAFGT